MDTYALTPQTLIALARTWEEHAARLGSAATTLSRRPAGFAPAVHAALDDFSDDWVRLLKCAQRVAEDHGDALRSCLSSALGADKSTGDAFGGLTSALDAMTNGGRP